MIKKGLLIVGSLVIGILIGYNLKSNINHDNKDILVEGIQYNPTSQRSTDYIESDIKHINKSALVEKTQYNPVRHRRADYIVNLKCIGSNLYEFNALDTVDVYFENKGDAPIEWTIKHANADTSVITGVLEVGEETPFEMYSLETGKYKLSLNGNVDSQVDFNVEITQLN